MALSIAAQTHSVSWQQVTRKIVSGDPLEVLDQLEAAARLAERDNDVALRTALSASALAFMIVDWSRFTDWPTWIQRFAESDALPSADSDASLNLARATGAMARALLRGEPNEILAPLGQHLESLLDTPCDSTQLALAAGTLLPWLQMSKNPAAAQALHGRMTAPHAERLLEPAGTQYLRGAWLGAWALHLHFTDKSRLPEALRVFDDYLAQVPSPRLQFRRARLATEQAMYEQDIERAEQALRDLLVLCTPDDRWSASSTTWWRQALPVPKTMLIAPCCT